MRSIVGGMLTLSVLALLVSMPASSAPAVGAADGWYMWQVEGGMTTGSSCCFRLAGKVSERTTCNLDNGHGIVIHDAPCGGASGRATFYLRKKDGVPVRIRLYDSNCDVSSSEPITDIGLLSLDESVTMLLDIVNEKKLDMDVREEALIWLAQSNADTAFAYFDELLSET